MSVGHGGRVAVISHGDLDGLAASATIIAASGLEETTLIFSQPYSLHSTIRRLVDGSFEKVFLVDLGLDEATWPSLRESLAKLAAKCQVVWVDHHVSTLRHAAELADLRVVLLFAWQGCASTIAREAFAHLTDNPGFYERLTVLGEISDSVAAGEGELKILAERLIAALSAPSARDDFRRELVSMWIREHRVISDEVALKAVEYEELLHKKLKELDLCVTFETARGLLIDARKIRLLGLAGRIASKLADERGKVVIVVFAPNEREVIATCRVPPRISFHAVKNLSQLAKRLGGGGGGLEKAASIRVPAELGDSLVKSLEELLRETLD